MNHNPNGNEQTGFTVTDITVHITRVNEPDGLYYRYGSQNQPQPVMLELDLEDGGLTCRVNPAIGNGLPESVFYGRILWMEIPILTAAAANQLLKRAEPIAQRIVDDAEIVWDGNKNVGRLGDNARAAYDELADLCDRARFDDSDTVSECDACDWFGGEGREQAIARLGLTALTTDEEIEVMAEAEARDARTGASHDAGYVLLDGAEDYLQDVRDDLRTTAVEELEHWSLIEITDDDMFVLGYTDVDPEWRGLSLEYDGESVEHPADKDAAADHIAKKVGCPVRFVAGADLRGGSTASVWDVELAD